MPQSKDTAGDLDRLKERFRTLADLGQIGGLLGWDMQTYLPPAGLEGRGRQAATLEAIAHEKLTDPEMGELIGRLSEANLSPEDDALVRLCRRRYEQETKIPVRLV